MKLLMDNCKSCNKEFENEAALHKHIKAHSLHLVEYYQKYYPRYDKLDHSIIRYKNKNQYFNTDFNSRENLRLWTNCQDKDIVKNYCKSILIKRKEKKQLIWTPSQVELRTTLMPPIQFYNDIFGDYYELCAELGFRNKYKNGLFYTKYNNFVVYCDSREKQPLKFSYLTIEKGLKFGDYTCSADITCNCYIERKSPQDFVGTFSGGIKRFWRELDKSVEANANIIVLIEDSLSNCLDFNKMSYIYHKNIRITPEFVFHNVRETIQKYPNTQFLFVNNREEASEMIEKIFSSECSYKNIDLQFFHDTRKI